MASSGTEFINYVKNIHTDVLLLPPSEIAAKRKVYRAELEEYYKKGYDLAIADAQGKTALMHAVILGNFLFIEWALEKLKAKNNPGINQYSTEGISASCFALQFLDPDTAKEEKENTKDTIESYVLKRRRQIANSLIKFAPVGMVTINAKQQYHVLGFASAAGNLWALRKFNAKLTERDKRSYLGYFLPLAVSSKSEAILQYWLPNIPYYDKQQSIISIINCKNVAAIQQAAKYLTNSGQLALYEDIVDAILATEDPAVFDCLDKIVLNSLVTIYSKYLLNVVSRKKDKEDIQLVNDIVKKLLPVYKPEKITISNSLTQAEQIASYNEKITNIDRAFITAVYSESFSQAISILQLKPNLLRDNKRTDIWLPMPILPFIKPIITIPLKGFGKFLQAREQLLTNGNTMTNLEKFAKGLLLDVPTFYFKKLLEACEIHDQDVYEELQAIFKTVEEERSPSEEKFHTTLQQSTTEIILTPTTSETDTPAPPTAPISQIPTEMEPSAPSLPNLINNAPHLPEEITSSNIDTDNHPEGQPYNLAQSTTATLYQPNPAVVSSNTDNNALIDYVLAADNKNVMNLELYEIAQAKEKCVQDLSRLSEIHHCDLRSTDSEGKTALMHAAILGNFLFIEWALSQIGALNSDVLTILTDEAISVMGFAVQFNDSGSDSPSLELIRRRQIVEDLIEAKVNFQHNDTLGSKQHHVAGLATAAGNYWFIKKYSSLFKHNIYYEYYVQYILPHALLSKNEAIISFWENTLEKKWPLRGCYPAVLLNTVTQKKEIALINAIVNKLKPFIDNDHYRQLYLSRKNSDYNGRKKAFTNLHNNSYLSIDEIDKAFVTAVYNEQFTQAMSILKLKPRFIFDKTRSDLYLPAPIDPYTALPRITKTLKHFGKFLQAEDQLTKISDVSENTKKTMDNLLSEVPTETFPYILSFCKAEQDEDIYQMIVEIIKDIQQSRENITSAPREDKITSSAVINNNPITMPSAPEGHEPYVPSEMGEQLEGIRNEPSAPIASFEHEIKSEDINSSKLTVKQHPGYNPRFHLPAKLISPSKIMEHHLFNLEVSLKGLNELAQKNPALRTEINNAIKELTETPKVHNRTKSFS